MKRKYWLGLAALPLAFAAPASAAELASGFGGPEGYGELSQGRNDDSSSNQLDLPFDINFFGNGYSSFWVNNNGNISFTGPLSEFTPSPFPTASRPIIAPYWADVDTRCGTCGAVYVASPNATTAAITWHDVGVYPNNSSVTNDFQLILSDRSSVAQAGDFDIEFRYNRLQWTTGFASGGDAQGLGGVPAQAGYDAGDQTNFFTLPGSRTGDVLDLATTSNVSLDTPGLWRFAIRNGEITQGETAETPLLPTVVTENGYEFDFGVIVNTRVFVDPIVAIGYDFIVNSGPNIVSALFPTIAGDTDGFEVFGYNSVTSQYDVALGLATSGVDFLFGPGGVSRFRVADVDGGLLPTGTEFVTGLTFASSGQVNLTQSPITINTTPGAVPEPASWAMLIAGFGMIGAAQRRRRRASLRVTFA